MLSGQLAINRREQRSGPLIAAKNNNNNDDDERRRKRRKVDAEVERPSERAEAQGASRPSHAPFTLDSRFEINRELP